MVLEIDFKSGEPVHAQIVAQVQLAAASGALRPSEALPAIGPLALELRINRNAIAKAYAELERLGVIESTVDRGFLLRQHAPQLHGDSRRKLLRMETETPAGTAAGSSPQTWRSFAASALPAVAYLALVGLSGLALVTVGTFENSGVAVLATLLPAAIFFPLIKPLQRAAGRVAERWMLAGRDSLIEKLQTLKAAVASATDMEGFIEAAVAHTAAAMNARIEWIHDYPAMLALVNTLPSLRSARAPVPAGSALIAPIAMGDELSGLLRYTKYEGHDAKLEPDGEDFEFLAAVAEHATTAAQLFRVRREKQEGEYALDIQQGLLPRNIPQITGFSIAGAWQPARVVGGDYYDVFPLEDGKVALIVGDVAGKGIPAALLMANLQASVQAYAQGESSPLAVCTKVNNAVYKSVTPGRFITFFYGVLDPASYRFDYVNAGHNPPLVARADGTVLRLESGGPVLGLFPDLAYEEGSVNLLPGDRVVLFTDGITEAASPGGEEFCEEGLISLLAEAARQDATGLRDTIMRQVAEFCRHEFHDDATLLIVVVER